MRPELWQSGDLLGFCGRGATSLSIQLGTCSALSHVAGICRVLPEDLEFARRVGHLAIPLEVQRHWSTRYVLFESTTLAERPCTILRRQIDGVQAHRPASRIREYDGSVYRYQVHPSWRERAENPDAPA